MPRRTSGFDAAVIKATLPASCSSRRVSGHSHIGSLTTYPSLLTKANPVKSLPEEDILDGDFALNVASPLGQGHKKRAQAENSKLKASTDPLVQAYWKDYVLPRARVTQAKGRLSQLEDKLRRLTAGVCAGAQIRAKAHERRGPNTDAEKNTWIRSTGGQCDPPHEMIDDSPIFAMDGAYLIRRLRCPTCTPARSSDRSIYTWKTTLRPVGDRQYLREMQYARWMRSVDG